MKKKYLQHKHGCEVFAENNDIIITVGYLNKAVSIGEPHLSTYLSICLSVYICSGVMGTQR